VWPFDRWFIEPTRRTPFEHAHCLKCYNFKKVCVEYNPMSQCVMYILQLVQFRLREKTLSNLTNKRHGASPKNTPLLCLLEVAMHGAPIFVWKFTKERKQLKNIITFNHISNNFNNKISKHLLDCHYSVESNGALAYLIIICQIWFEK